MPSERNGLQMFYRELNRELITQMFYEKLSAKRTSLMHYASQSAIDFDKTMQNFIPSYPAIPVGHYIDWLKQLVDIQRGSSGDFHALAQDIKRRLVGGVYRVDKGTIAFQPYRKQHAGKVTKAMGLHATSGIVKSLFGLCFYLENQAKSGDLLMIDEPELNLHPRNQLAISRLLARLVNAGPERCHQHP